MPSSLLVQQSSAVLKAGQGKAFPTLYPSPTTPPAPHPKPRIPRFFLGYFLQLKALLPVPHS